MLTQEAVNPQDIFKGSSASAWDIFSGVTAPIFHAGTLKAERHAAEADARLALARYQLTVLTAFVQVSDVLSALGADDQAITSLKLVNQAADAGALDAQNALKLGGGPLIDVVSAQRSVGRARRALAEAEGRRMSDLVALYAATAADWRPANYTAPIASRMSPPVGLGQQEDRDQRDEAQDRHVDRDGGGRLVVGEEGSRDDRRETAAGDGPDLVAQRSSRIAELCGEELGHQGRLASRT